MKKIQENKKQKIDGEKAFQQSYVPTKNVFAALYNI
jgi:hypothetical protein